MMKHSSTTTNRPVQYAGAPDALLPAEPKKKHRIEPTDEQKHILDVFSTGAPMVIQAGAGTGKTTTLELIAERMAREGRRGVYITLNRAMAKDVGSAFVHGNVSTSTIHSLAWRVASRIPQIAPLLEKINSDEPPLSRFHWHLALDIDDVFCFESFFEANRRVRGEGKSHTVLSSQSLMWAAIDALRLWCQSDREVVTEEDVERPATMPIDQWRERYVPLVISIAERAWKEDILDPNGKLPFTHDYYLKLVTLARPRITEWLGLEKGSVLFFDEAQDSRPCVTYLLSQQTDMQIVAVGDSSQAIYQFTGARDGLPKIEKMAGANTASLTTSFRFGQDIADIANEVLDVLDAPIRLRGNPAKRSEVVTVSTDTVPDLNTIDAILVHTNAELLLMAELCSRTGVQYEIMADTYELYNIGYDFDRLQADRPATRTDLRDFQTIEELEDFISDDSILVNAARTHTCVIAQWLLGHSTAEMNDILEKGVVNGQRDETRHTVVISTIHKSKGRQWDNVWVKIDPNQSLPFFSMRLSPRVVDGQLVDSDSRVALMMTYVALTRAKNMLLLDTAFVDALNMLPGLVGGASLYSGSGGLDTEAMFLTPN